MGRPPTGRPRGRPRKPPVDAEGFGYSPPEAPPTPVIIPTPPEIIALGLPPEDAPGIQKWNYAMSSTLAALALRDETVPLDVRTKRFLAASLAASRHYPEAARYDLAQKIEADAAALVGRKKAKAAAKLETRPPAGAAKVIPTRPGDAQEA